MKLAVISNIKAMVIFMIEVLRICQLGFPEADILQIVELEVLSILLRFLNFLLIGFFSLLWKIILLLFSFQDFQIDNRV